MALTRDFRETVQARVQNDKEFRRGLLSDAVESLLAGEAALGREILRDFINATIGFPTLAERTGIHVKTLHQMFGPKGNPTATNLFNIIACLQEHEGVRLQVVAWASVQSQVSAAGAGASGTYAYSKSANSSTESSTSRRIALNRPRPIVSPECIGTVVVLPSGCLRNA